MHITPIFVLTFLRISWQLVKTFDRNYGKTQKTVAAIETDGILKILTYTSHTDFVPKVNWFQSHVQSVKACGPNRNTNGHTQRNEMPYAQVKDRFTRTQLMISLFRRISLVYFTAEWVNKLTYFKSKKR